MERIFIHPDRLEDYATGKYYYETEAQVKAESPASQLLAENNVGICIEIYRAFSLLGELINKDDFSIYRLPKAKLECFYFAQQFNQAKTREEKIVLFQVNYTFFNKVL
jgi:hypothetical protein